ncbi:hypothetical protein OPV22_022282 [Ensete ventricosum]|uniref:Uncharacterized protein n=1 Tax=Ensete ventricosum TaxID=4639 RepID=A0AAV8QS75_ENSVE|nr:hypothetical protein OPV22_022282 [Ensete ventricosum]
MLRSSRPPIPTIRIAPFIPPFAPIGLLISRYVVLRDLVRDRERMLWGGSWLIYFHDNRQGAIVTTFMVCYALTSFISGYLSGGLYAWNWYCWLS